MKPKIIYSDKFLNVISFIFIVDGISLFPFIFLREKFKGTVEGNITINHELIHFKQSIELLFIGFYIFYIFNFLINLIKYKDITTAYENILLEKEAYKNEKDMDYLNKRKIYNWIK